MKVLKVMIHYMNIERIYQEIVTEITRKHPENKENFLRIRYFLQLSMKVHLAMNAISKANNLNVQFYLFSTQILYQICPYS